MLEDHALHFYVLGGPDFVLGPTADAGVRNILGVIGAVGLEVGKKVISMRRRIREVITLLGGLSALLGDESAEVVGTRIEEAVVRDIKVEI